MNDQSVDANITRIINHVKDRPEHMGEVYSYLYDDIKNIAHHVLNRLPAGATITATVLVHETYEKCVRAMPKDFQDRQHFLRSLAVIMRNYLLDVFRKKNALKSGKPDPNHSLTQAVGDADINLDYLDFDRALDQITVIDPNHTQLIEMKVLFGMTFDEMAEVLGISSRQTMRRWQVAKALLASVLKSQSA